MRKTIMLWLTVAIFAVLSLYLLWKLYGLLLTPWTTTLDQSNSLALAGVISSLLALALAVPGTLLLVDQIRSTIEKPRLKPEFIVRLRPDDSATEPCYYVEVSLQNDSQVTARHFRFFCNLYLPTNPGDPSGRPWPINVHANFSVGRVSATHVDNYSTADRVLPRKRHPSGDHLTGWETRVSDLNVYPGDHLLLATLEVFGPLVTMDWRLDTEAGKSTGSVSLPRPSA